MLLLTMRVLLLSTLHPNRVQPHKGQFVRERLRQLRKRCDFDWRIVAPVPWFPFGYDIFGSYGMFARVPAAEDWEGDLVVHPRYPLIPRIGDALAPLGYARAVARCIRKHNIEFDVIDAHFFFPDGAAAALLGRQLGKPVVVTARGSDINLMTDELAAGRWIRWAAKRSDRLVAVSRPLAAKLRELSGGREVLLAPNGVDTERFRPPAGGDELRRALGLRGRMVLSVGNLVALKGHDLIIEAVAGLPEVDLLIAGDGPRRRDLEDLVGGLGMGHRVKLLGTLSQQELVRHYSAADALVLASSTEGSPNVVLESLACGTPVIATVESAVPEGPSAVDVTLVERSVPALRQAIVRRLAIERDAFAVRSRAMSLGWDATCAALEALFDGMGQASSAAAA